MFILHILTDQLKSLAFPMMWEEYPSLLKYWGIKVSFKGKPYGAAPTRTPCCMPGKKKKNYLLKFNNTSKYKQIRMFFTCFIIQLCRFFWDELSSLNEELFIFHKMLCQGSFQQWVYRQSSLSPMQSLFFRVIQMKCLRINHKS